MDQTKPPLIKTLLKIPVFIISKIIFFTLCYLVSTFLIIALGWYGSFGIHFLLVLTFVVLLYLNVKSRELFNFDKKNC
ncbi:MAG: hypothetical protein NTV72_01760 [Candidatus Taylorbacteria bacterium]|nr:hypothetical protein [Candidatus Taylorbacteria bacterium]